MFVISPKSVVIKKTRNRGLGVFAKKEIKKRTVIGDYTGTLVNYLDVDYEAEKKQMYLMYYNDKYGIYPDLSKPGVHLIYNSCSPNCWLTKFKDRTLVFALRDIMPGEEITINYLLPPKSSCKDCLHNCFCQSLNCSEKMHLSEINYKKWQKFQKENWKETGPTNKSKYLKSLKTYPKKISKDYLTKLIKNRIIKKTTLKFFLNHRPNEEELDADEGDNLHHQVCSFF